MLDLIEGIIEVLKVNEFRKIMFQVFGLLIIGILTDNAFYTMKAKCYTEAFIDQYTSNFKKQLTTITEKEGYYEIR